MIGKLLRLLFITKPTKMTPRNSGPRNHHIVVAGEVYIHWLSLPAYDNQQGKHQSMVKTGGRAKLLSDLLEEVPESGNLIVHGPPPLDEIGDRQLQVRSRLITLDKREDAPRPGRRFAIKRTEHLSLRNSSAKGMQPIWHSPSAQDLEHGQDLKLLIIQEPTKLFAGQALSEAEEHLEKHLAQNPQLVLFKMARPVTDSPLLSTIRKSAETDRLIVIVNAEDLREAGIELSRHLSWEKTSEDFIWQFMCKDKYKSLSSCAHLIVLFGCDGVIYHYRNNPNSNHAQTNKSTLYFNTQFAEGDFVKHYSEGSGDVPPGITTAFTAGFALALANVSSTLETENKLRKHIADAIREGLQCACRLAREGFQTITTDGEVSCPMTYIMTGDTRGENKAREALAKSHQRETKPIVFEPLEIEDIYMEFKEIEIPLPFMKQPDPHWSILEAMRGNPLDLAERIVKQGATKALTDVPIGRFGNVSTADRHEIESFRAITNLIGEYSKAKAIRTKPLCIGAFGPPGSGKSFMAKEVVKAVLTRPQILECNLSQVKDNSDLIATFHQVRDLNLEKEQMPVVLFDEFDTRKGESDLGWLNHFLAPMQDGKFLDHGKMHPLGAAVFVFIGGTSRDYNEFATHATKTAAKGRDFVSRLLGYVNIRGPDRYQKNDRLYPIRRAIFLDALLDRYGLGQGKRPVVHTTIPTPGQTPDRTASRSPGRSSDRSQDSSPDSSWGGTLDRCSDGFLDRSDRSSDRSPERSPERSPDRIDRNVLYGILTIPTFNHGARSLEAILEMSILSGTEKFGRAALPSEDQLNLHVNAEEFLRQIRSLH